MKTFDHVAQSRRLPLNLVLMTIVCSSVVRTGESAEPVRVGFGTADITPTLTPERPVWVAGIGPNNLAKQIHTRLNADAIYLDDGTTSIAFVSVDLIGLQHDAVKRLRKRLEQVDYACVSSTHTHASPDVIGIWGPSRTKTGKDPHYVSFVEDKVVEAVRKARSSAVPAVATYGQVQATELLNDSRRPHVLDDVLRVMIFHRNDADGEPLGILVQWSVHPQSVQGSNRPLSADYCASLRDTLGEVYGCPVVFFIGATGGYMNAVYSEEMKSAGRLGRAELYGQALAEVAKSAIASSEPVDLAPIAVHSRRIALPLANPTFRRFTEIGVLDRELYRWRGRSDLLGEPLAKGESDSFLAIESEVALARIGEIPVCLIPGEIYPELVYGGIVQPPDPRFDFPDAPAEPNITSLLGTQRFLLFGLANDEVGYIIPKCQWDDRRPYGFNGTSTYGERMSVGPDVAPIVLKAFEDCARSLKAEQQP
ncbi:hypothetical protein [Planctomycetes bacterium Pan216]